MVDETRVKVIFSKNIIKLRKNRHLTQGDLADLLKVGVSTVSDWETAKKLPRAGAIEKLASVFGVTKSSLFEEGHNKNPLSMENGSDDDNELMEGIKRIAKKHNMDLSDPKTLDLMDSALDLIKRMRSE